MSPVYKKYQCRYFDEHGNPLNPSCNQGDRCRYVHPTDPNWPGLKPAPSISPPSSSFTRRDSSRSDFNPKATDNNTKSRAPLVPQSEMFRLCKEEADNDSWILEDDRRRPREWDNDHHDSHDRERSSHRDRDRPRGRNRSRDRVRSRNASQNASASKSRPRSPSQHATPLPLKENQKDVAENDQENSPGSSPLVEITVSDRSEKLTDLFRRLIRLSNQAFQDTAACEVADQKLQTYTDISATLSKFSASAVGAIAPTMAEIVLKQATSKQRAEESFTNLEAIWEQIFDILIAEIAKAIDESLEQALDTMRNEAERIFMGLPKKSLKRRSAVGFSLSEAEEHGDRKRRRLSGWSPSPSPHRESAPNLASLHDILNEMKSKLDLQTHALQALTKENSELKNTFRNRTVSSSTSASTTPGTRAHKIKNTTPTEPRFSRQDANASHGRPTRSTHSPSSKRSKDI